MTALARQIDAEHPATDAGNGISITPLRKQLAGDIQTPLLVLLGAVGFVLLIACANVASLLLHAPRRVTGDRRLRGSGRQPRTLVAPISHREPDAVSGGGALGIALALWCTSFLVSIFPNDIANLSIPASNISP